MTISAQRIQAVKQALLEEVEIGVETNRGYDNKKGEYRYLSRSIKDRDFADNLEIDINHLRGILNLLKEEGFILDYRGGIPIYSSVSPHFIESGEYATEVYFPLNISSFKDNLRELPEVYFDRKSGAGSVNGERFTLEPNHPMHELFSLLYDNVQEPVERDDILTVLNALDTPEKYVSNKLNEVITNLRKKTGLSKHTIINKKGYVTLRAHVPEHT